VALTDTDVHEDTEEDERRFSLSHLIRERHLARERSATADTQP